MGSVITFAGAAMLCISCYTLEVSARIQLQQMQLLVSLDSVVQTQEATRAAEHARLEAHIKWFIRVRSGKTMLERLEAAMEEYDVANQQSVQADARE